MLEAVANIDEPALRSPAAHAAAIPGVYRFEADARRAARWVAVVTGADG